MKRASIWGFLLFAAAAWLVIGWAVLRLEPRDAAAVAGPVVLFGAVCEGLRTLAGTKTWWLNAGLAVLFAATGGVLLAEAGSGSSFTAPASLVGWYLLVRGAVDVAVGFMTRGQDRVWGLLVTVGVLETGLGFFSASPFARAADLVLVVLGALGILRAVADLVTALRLREMAPPRRDVLELPPERAAGVAGYAAGLADGEGAPRSRARHRARPGGSTVTEPAAVGRHAQDSFHDHVVRTTADLDAMLAQAGITGPRPGTAVEVPPDVVVPDSPAGVERPLPVAGAERPAAGR
ncbi:hypothetical protein [Actinoplanes utahensis]|uniref:hypothetical protein n=1 Tax=Actinoplanes utahensis TaxID=1869 RepID=UPI001F259C63|nr:hypothetical protein [Actinoplanes utahensis]